MDKAVGLVQFGPRQCEFEEFPFPRLHEGDTLVRIEANGMCASDVDSYIGTDFYWQDGVRRILGHEIVGVIEEMGKKTNNLAGFSVGDRVCVNAFVVCGTCPSCLEGDQQACTGFSPVLHYGVVPTSVSPALWGGYASHVYVPRGGIMYKMPSDVSALDATLWNPLGGGYEWGVIRGGIKPGDKVLIMGPGQRGLAAIFPARHAGADVVAVTGLTKDLFKMDLALEFGADAVVNVEKQDLLEWGREVTGGRGFDVILDTTPHAVQPLVDAVSLVKKKGTIVVIGIKGRTLDNFPIDQFLFRKIRLQGWAGQSDASQRLAADLVASKRYPLHKMRTHVFGFDQLDTAINVLTGDAPGENAINVVVTPTMSS